MAIWLDATTHEPIEIQDSNEENKKKGVGVVWRIIEVVTKVGQTTKSPQMMVQPYMVEQQLMIPSSFQLGLANLLISILANRIILQCQKVDQQTLAKMGIKILNENIYFFTLTKQSYSK